MLEQPSHRIPDELELQAHAWLRRLKSGTARAADAQALRRWCATSAAHARAFEQAQRMWDELLPAAVLAGAGDPELSALRNKQSRKQTSGMSRRAFMGGALATSCAAIAGVALIHPPLDLWPSAADAWRADFRTAAGEQRGIELASGVSVEMNTRSAIAVQTLRGEAVGIDLLDGEVAVDATKRNQPFVVSAAGGRTSGLDARFELRHMGNAVCVTCIEGMVKVASGGDEVVLRAAQQVTYDSQAIQAIRSINPIDASAWRSGILSFRQTALAQVVAEINRYRPGRVVLMAKGMADKPVSGRFHIRDLDKAIAQIQRLFKLDVTSLPGGLVLLK
ncbi:FecR family protein [Herminiimonas glaciei]|uniref:FecR family protein n=1 Tax=Herminiimonas glaciei TaxID=523788 RepID=A0ABW2I759_9BURK